MSSALALADYAAPLLEDDDLGDRTPSFSARRLRPATKLSPRVYINVNGVPLQFEIADEDETGAGSPLGVGPNFVLGEDIVDLSGISPRFVYELQYVPHKLLVYPKQFSSP